MAGAIANLSATLRWDLDDFKRGTAQIENAFTSIIGVAGKMADAVARAGQRMTVGLTLPLSGIAVLTTKAASDAEELQSAFDFTFGAMSKGMNQWAEQTGDAMGRATQEMQQGALAFGQLFKAAAPTEQAAARLSQRFTELAQDAASFFNTDFETAMGKIRSGLTGEAEPLRDFGVFLSAAAVEAKALEMGIIDAGQEVDEYGKIMARSALIAEGLAAAQGDIERTSGSLANRVRELQSNIREMAVEIGELLVPYAQKLVSVLQGVVAWIKDLPDWVKKAAIGFGVFLAVLGPLSIALSILAITILPLLLVSMGPVFAIISAIINPIGTLVVLAGKAIAAFGGFGAVIGALARVFLRLAGPVGAVITLLMMFGDDIARGIGHFFRAIQEAVGPKVQEMFARLADLGARVGEALDTLAASPVGQFFSDLIALAGALIEVLLYLAGTIIGEVLAAVVEFANGLIDMVSGAVDVTNKLLTGDWASAWDAAVQVVGRAMIRIGDWLKGIWPLLGGVIRMLGVLTGATIDTPAMPGGKKGPIGDADDLVARLNGGEDNGRNYALAEDGRSPSRSTRGRTGPTAAELAEEAAELERRREAIRLEQELAVARESGDVDAIRATERKIELAGLIERYRRVELSDQEALRAALADQAELDAVRAQTREDALRDSRLETEYQIAQINNDQRHLQYLEDEEQRERDILALQERGWDRLVAEEFVQASIATIERARADNAARRLADEERIHQIELARLRGDSESSIRALQNDLWITGRAAALEEDMSPRDAMAQAMREGAEREQAHLQGTFRDAFRNGLQAALDGDLKGFFENWMKERSFNALSKVLNSLADGLADLVSGQSGSSGGGFLSFLGSIFGASKGPANLLAGTPYDTPGFNAGGSFKISGHPGIDKNLLSLNGNPIARVSHGEIVDVKAANDRGGDTVIRVQLDSDVLNAQIVQGAGRVVLESAPHIASMGANEAMGRIGKAQNRMLGG